MFLSWLLHYNVLSVFGEHQFDILYPPKIMPCIVISHLSKMLSILRTCQIPCQDN